MIVIIETSFTTLPKLVLLPTYAQASELIESGGASISPKEEPNTPLEDPGIYTKNRITTQMLAF